MDVVDRAVTRRTGRLAPALLALLLALGGCSLPQITVHEDPLSPAEHLTLGLAAAHRGDLDRSIAECEAAGKQPGALTCRADAWFLKGDRPKAEDLYRKALAADPKDAVALNNLAWLLYADGRDLDEAESLAQRAVAAAPPQRLTDYRDTLEHIRTLKAARALEHKP